MSADLAPAALDSVLLEMCVRLRAADGALETMLHEVSRAASEVLGGARTSIRILDETRTRLLVAARTGAALGDHEFKVGEGLAGWVVARAESICVDDAETDPRFVAKEGQVDRVGAFVGVPLLDRQGAIGVLAATSREVAFSSTQLRWMQVIAGVATPYLDVARLNRIAITDELTLALNRRALEALIPRDPPAGDSILSVALFDIDHFKTINDRLGHASGDDVLRAVPRLLAAMLRRDDAVVRLGGDEFLLVLRGVDADVAMQIAERACAAVAGAGILREPVTLSAGVAERGRGESRDDLLARADRALYRAKAAGRNQAACDR
jgi:diguanylate cyclase (GGDEF)-like protein